MHNTLHYLLLIYVIFKSALYKSQYAARYIWYTLYMAWMLIRNNVNIKGMFFTQVSKICQYLSELHKCIREH